jgi:glutathione S-transferase
VVGQLFLPRFVITQTLPNVEFASHDDQKTCKDRTTTEMIIPFASPLVFKYLALPVAARGGVLRFFLLSHGVAFEEQLIAMNTWSTEKQRLISSGENPSGTLPIIYAKNNNDISDSTGDAHPQHIAVSRYLARVYQLTSEDPYKDYVQDLVADEYLGFRDQWVATTFGGNDETKAKYSTVSLPIQLTKFNALYQQFKTEETFLSTSAKTRQPLWGDAAVFGLLWDHTMTGYLTVEDLNDKYPHLAALFAAYHAIPAVNHWIETKMLASKK